nr:unnamed protein product [Digitaria exilis]
MGTASSAGVVVCTTTAQSTRPSTPHEPQKVSPSPTDQRRALQLLEDHRPWDALDDTVLAIIDQTYALLLAILGLAPKAPGRAVRVVTHLAAATAADPDDDSPSPATPVLRVVVEASAGHCRTSVIDRLDTAWWERPEDARYVSAWDPRRGRQQIRRASVRTAPGMVLLAGAEDDAGGGAGAQGQGGHHDHGVEEEFGEGVAVCEEAVLGVLDAMRSRLDAAVQAEAGMVRMARTSGCRNRSKIMDIVLVRMALEGMRRQLDVGAVMRRFRYRRQYYLHARYREISRRRPAAEMDVDQVDEAEVVTKRLKAMHL